MLPTSCVRLSLIRATAELALRRDRDPEGYPASLRQIEQDAARMTELTESLLTLARARRLPFSLNSNWNLIGRFILPFESMPEGLGSASGIGDMIVSGFLSPKNSRHLIWGAGPVVTLPATTNRALGSGKWSAGPTVALLRQSGSMTYGFLGNQVWSYASAGGNPRRDVNQAYFQPMIAHAWHSGVTVTATSETIAN